MAGKNSMQAAPIVRFEVRMTNEEFSKLENAFKNSTCRKRTTYYGYLLLEHPVTIFTRNKSVDELMVILRQLKTELQQTQDIYNISLPGIPARPEVYQLKTPIAPTAKQHDQIQLLLENIYHLMQKINAIWLQE